MNYALPTACRILDVRVENYRTHTLILDARLEAEPGQFVMLWLPRFDEKPFSLVAADPVTLMISAVGPFTRLVHELEVDDHIWMRGPFGRGFSLQQNVRAPLLIGGGYGVAPLHWLARALTAREGVESLTTIIGARTAVDLLLLPAFRALEESAALPLQTLLATEDGSAGARGRVTDVVAARLALPAGHPQRPDALFACGPHAMLHALEAMAGEHSVPLQAGWEAYMRCAMGICGACECDGALLCMDGPVLTSGLKRGA